MQHLNQAKPIIEEVEMALYQKLKCREKEFIRLE
jgi:hypothetical protein